MRGATGLLAFLLACGGQAPESSPAPERAPTATTPPTPDAVSERAATQRPGDETANTPAPEPQPEVHGLPPLTDEQRQALLAGPEDPFIAVDTHYIQSNETRHDLFFPYIEGKGGAFIGVGSDQSYTMMAVARSELAFMIDIDSRVVDLHRIYDVLIRRSEQPQALLDSFSDANRQTTTALLNEAFADQDDAARRRILRGFKVGRETVFKHLERVIDRTVDGDPASWLSNRELYDHVRDLFMKRRVRVMAGNLTGKDSLASIAKAVAALGTEVGVLYMSNAEEYFKYTHGGFSASVKALPRTADTVVLRTIYSKLWEHADLWAYQVQPLDDFCARLDDPTNRSRKPMFRNAERDKTLDRNTGKKGLTLIGEPTRGPGAAAG